MLDRNLFFFSDDSRWNPNRDDLRGDIKYRDSPGPKDSFRANLDHLPHGGASPNECPLSDFNTSAEHGSCTHEDVISELAIVLYHSASVDGDVLAQDRTWTDHAIRHDLCPVS